MKLVIILSLVGLAITIPTCNILTATKDAVWQEVNPKELNHKYEWFKDSHARLTSLQQQIATKQEIINSHKQSLSSIPRDKWSRDDVQQSNVSTAELAGIKAAFNNLAAEYNAEMAKWHTSFTNAGKMPEGSSLPQSIIPYTN